MREKPHTAEQFWARKEMSESGCWLWTGSLKANGYGSTTTGKGRIDYVHRYAWQLINGDIPKGMYICHKCDTPRCFNPDHLFLGSATDNMQDAISKGRTSRGSRHSPFVRGSRNANSILTPEAVDDIMAGVKAGLSYAVAGAPWRVGKSGVSHVVKGRSWKHIERPA